MKLNLYLLTPATDPYGYDVFTSVVVAARTAAEAELIHPSGKYEHVEGEWLLKAHNALPVGDRLDDGGVWPSVLDDVAVKRIGKAAPGVKPGVVLAAFHAG